LETRTLCIGVSIDLNLHLCRDNVEKEFTTGAADFYVPLFPPTPRPDLSSGMQTLRDLFAARYPAAANLRETDIVDTSIIDEVERSGFIERLYAGAPR